MVLFGLIMTGNLAAETWPNLEKKLDDWLGAREVQLVSEAGDPLASDELLPLIEVLLKHNYAVNTASETSASGEGLLVEIRRLDAQTLIVLKRASDHSIIALERMTNERLPAVVAVPGPVASQQTVTPPPPMPMRQQAPIPIEGSPISLVWLDESSGSDATLALLSKAGVALCRLQERQLQKLSVIAPPKDGLRPLSLSRGDVDGDGSFELAAVWAEDIYSVYDGTESNIWSQLIAVEPQKLTSLGLQAGYVRLFDSLGVTQRRGTYRPFTGPVQQLLYRQGRISTGQTLPWGEQNIFSLTPLGDGDGLAWLRAGILSALSMDTGEPLSGGTILEDLGHPQTAQIAVRLEEPEYRSGFGKEDQVLERYISLPSRLVAVGAHSMLTINRGRKSGTFLLGKPTGEDRLVRLTKNTDGLSLDYPFPAVPSFIVDFTLVPGKDSFGALSLLNDKEDASGQAYLLYQTVVAPY